LLGFLVGALAAGWLLGATEVEAEEIPLGEDTVTVDAPVTDTVDLVGHSVAAGGPATATAAEETGEQVEAADSSPDTEVSQPVETVETFEAAEPVEVRPLTDSAAQAGRETTATVREVSETVTPEAEAAGTDLVEPVRWAVDEITRTVDDRLDPAEAPSREEADPAPAPEEDSTTHPQAAVERDDALLDPEHQRAETAVALAGHADSTVSEPDTDSGATPPIDPLGSVPSGTASTSNGAVSGLAGHLPTAGTLIPALAFEDAARHVLHAVPTAVADEPTFAPD
ncbi:MAG TPA: hypothetical protein K8V84_05615, partial [Nocardiopsis listeri]|uniref:hypothetical protein n=1 Tax=Nocardiopsis listeri TaxID=53440 RepID=UPI001E06637A